jgi:hypothetical protein
MKKSKNKYYNKKHPLIYAIELKEKAVKCKANPKIIAQIEKTIKSEAKKSAKILKNIDKLIEDVNKTLKEE